MARITYGADLNDVKSRLAEKAEDVCRWLLPNGVKSGSEWRVGNIDGDEGRSLGVHLTGDKAGIWQDFASGHGGDLLDLIAAVKDVELKDAIKSAREWLGMPVSAPKSISSVKIKKTYAMPDTKGIHAPSGAMVDWFAKRGITRETMNMFKISERTHKDGKIDIVFPYIYKDGDKAVHLKFRPLHSKKDMYTSKDTKHCLFGWHLVSPQAREIVLTEGEIDAMTLVQRGVNALSVPNGGGEAGKQDAWIDIDYESLLDFETVYLALDGDEVGKKAAEYIADRLGRHRCKMVSFGEFKDANEVLMAGGYPEKSIYLAKPCDPPEIGRADECIDDAIMQMQEGKKLRGERLPWKKTFDFIAFRRGDTTVWAGINGHGKSQILHHICVHSLKNGHRWFIASMEYVFTDLLEILIRQSTARISVDSSMSDKLKDFFSGLLYYDPQRQQIKPDRLLEIFEYVWRRYNVDNFLIDSLTKCGFAEDDYSGQKMFVEKLSEFARCHGVRIHLVCHIRKGDDENKMPGKMDVKGAGGITDMVNNVIIVWRDKQKDKEVAEAQGSAGAATRWASSPDTKLGIVKFRQTGWEGRVGLWFDKLSLQFLEHHEDKPVRYVE